MARYRRKRHYRHSRGMTIPIAPVLGLAAPIAEEWGNIQAGNYNQAMTNLLWKFTGFNKDAGAFQAEGLWHGAAPLIAGLLVHKFVGGAPLNANRILANAGVPILRI